LFASRPAVQSPSGIRIDAIRKNTMSYEARITVPPDDWLAGGGEMGELVRAYDWSTTELGPIDAWPQSLRTTLRICLHSRYPMFVWWGMHLTNIYNDAYIPVLGKRHPAALGKPAAEIWHEIWGVVGPQAEIVINEERATWNEQVLLVMQRHGFVEETYFTFSYSPAHDDAGRVAGVFCACIEDTARVLSERRLNTLRSLAASAMNRRSVDEACAGLAAALGENPLDVPFSLIYLCEGDETARLAAATGLAIGSCAAPEIIDIHAASEYGTWPVGPALDRLTILSDLEGRFCAPLPGGAWPEPTTRAAVLPIARPGQDRPTGALVIGLSPRRPVDDGYEGFLNLVAGHIATGIADARAYEEERHRAEALAEIDRAKTAFFSNVSHEFRTPLTLMLGPTEDALASDTRALAGDDLETLYRNELRLLRLVNALLDFSRIEAGRMQASYVPTDLAQLTTDLASSFRSAFGRAGLHFDVSCDPLSEPIYVDREMWEKIVLNLLSNALKFTFEGGVHVRLSEGPREVSLSVRDTGIGIAETDLPRVFDRFHRIEGARARTHEGSGIGLAIVNDLVRLHGGSCAIESAPGSGTTVTVSLRKGTAHLPADRLGEPRLVARTKAPNPFVVEALRWLPNAEADGDAETLVEPDLDATPGSDLGALAAHILVADDNADMRDYLTRLLRRRWSVEAVADGKLALEAIGRRRPDLVLTDIMMPNLDGFQLLRALRSDERRSAIPVIMLSARAGEEARIEGVQAGADDYLVKPFSARELVARIHAQLRLAHAARERAELLVREQEARREAELQKRHLYSLFMQAPMAIAVLRGRDYVVELANPTACSIWGRRHADVIDRPLFEALPEIRDQVFLDLLNRVYETGVPHVGSETPTRLDRRGDGSRETMYLSFVYTPLRNARDEIDGILVIASDVTDQVTARTEMSRLREAAETANRAKDEFLAMLGHELRNPLAPILTALQLLKLRGVDAAERERVIIERQVRHLVSLVDDLLDVSRITRGKIALKHEPVEAADAVARAIETASPLLEQQRHELIVGVPRGLVVTGDAGRLAQVMANLLTNAAKYTEPGGAITVTGRAEGEDVVLCVRDTGIGIEPEMLPRIFDLFVQERQTLERSRGGLGLGLAIVRNLVVLHGGSVTAHSAGKGQGSEFTIRLRRATALAPRAPADSGRAAEAPATARGARVLIVDDNHDAAVLLNEMLSALGYVTRFVHDGPSALTFAQEFQPDFALLDIGLPVMDGYELARRFSEHPPLRRTRLIALTGYGQRQDRQRSTEAGFGAHLVKPVDIEELRAALESVGGQPREAVEARRDA
jgi:PAS domain S-box-containing protein